MLTWINMAAVKVATLNKELECMRKKYAIATNSSSVALESLRVLTCRATEAAQRSGRAAAKSVIAAKRVANATMNLTGHGLLISAELSEIAAETATKAAAEAAELVHEVLLAARTVAAKDENVNTIQGTMTSILIAIRSAEAAAAATKLAQSVTALAGSVTLTTI